MKLKRGIDRAVEKIIEALKKASQGHQGPEGHRPGRTISANGDQALASSWRGHGKVGKEGVITIEEAKVDGDDARTWSRAMQFDRGYLSPLLRATDASAWK